MRPHEQYPRPVGPYYETRFPYLSQGDIFPGVPFGTLGPVLTYPTSLPGAVIQPIEIHRELILSPTCDFRRPSASQLNLSPQSDPHTLQSHVVMAPVRALAAIAELWGEKRESNSRLLRKFDTLRRYMYLPPLPRDDLDQEWVVDLTAPDRVAIGLLLSDVLPARLTQLTFAAAQQLQYKIVLAATSRFSNRGMYEPPMD